MSDELQWVLLRNYNSYLVKGGHHPPFSRDPNNLLNIHSQRFSGFRQRPFGVNLNKTGDFEISYKKDGSIHDWANVRETKSVKKNAGLHKAVKAILEGSKEGQRGDLSRIAATRAFTLGQSRRARKSKTYEPKA